MTTRAQKTEDLSIDSAIETLSTVADLELTSTVQDPLMEGPVEEGEVVIKTVRWLHKKNAKNIVCLVREKLKVVLNYFRHFYRSERERFTRSETVDGMRTIMLLVDEAVENVDRYTNVFFGSQTKGIKKSKEFVDLCSFYKKRIIPIATHRHVSSWIGALPLEEILFQGNQEKGMEKKPCISLSVEIERLKRGEDYELLFIRKPDGSRFFTQKLLRNMRLACDVEEAVERNGRSKEAQLEQMRHEQLASEIFYLLGNTYPAIDSFMHSAHRGTHFPLILDLYTPTVALMDAGIHMIHHSEHLKTAEGYFGDFCCFLKKYYSSMDFRRLLTYPPKNEESWEYAVFRLAESFASQIVHGAPLSLDMVRSMKTLIQQGFFQAVQKIGHPDGTFSRDLDIDYESVRSLVGKRERFSHFIQQINGANSFEPLLGQTIPTHIFDLSWRGDIIPMVRLPSPTYQEYVHKASISNTFQLAMKRRIRAFRDESALLINVQDSTSWKEEARCRAIEQFVHDSEFSQHITLCSINKNGDFYQQTGSYEEKDSIDTFIENLLDHMCEKDSNDIRSDLEQLVRKICQCLYPEQKVLTQGQRRGIIEFVQTAYMIRIIAETHPATIFISCKDGVDTTLPTMAALYYFQVILNKETPTSAEQDWLRGVLFGLPLLSKERLVFPNRHHRLIDCMSLLERMSASKESTKAILEFLPNDIASSKVLPASGHQPTYFRRRYDI